MNCNQNLKQTKQSVPSVACKSKQSAAHAACCPDEDATKEPYCVECSRDRQQCIIDGCVKKTTDGGRPLESFYNKSVDLLKKNPARQGECNVLDICTTKDLLIEYMSYRLENKGFNLKDHKHYQIRETFRFIGKLTINEPSKIIADFGNKLDSDHSNKMFLDKPVKCINIRDGKAESNYQNWVNELFRDKRITWGRLVLTMVFTARLAEDAMVIEDYDRVGHLIEWCCVYFRENRFEEWITATGGWVKLPPVEPVRTLSLSCRLPGVGSLALGAFILIVATSLGYVYAMKKH